MASSANPIRAASSSTPEALTIQVAAIDGPFRQLDNHWRFEPAGEKACRVHFDITYEFRSRTLAMLLGGVFDRAFRRFAEAFEKRADALYGAASRQPAPSAWRIACWTAAKR